MKLAHSFSRPPPSSLIAFYASQPNRAFETLSKAVALSLDTSTPTTVLVSANILHIEPCNIREYHLLLARIADR